MSWWKKKKKFRLRNCHARISPDCQPIYETVYKHSGRRTACPQCHLYLKKIGISMEEYKMENIEKFEWINKEEIRAIIECQRDIINEEQKKVGVKNEQSVQMTNKQEMQEGIALIQEMLNKHKNQIEIYKRQLEKIGRVAKSSEIIRLEENLKKLAKIKKSEELQNKINELQKEVDLNEEIFKKRREFLDGG